MPKTVGAPQSLLQVQPLLVVLGLASIFAGSVLLLIGYYTNDHTSVHYDAFWSYLCSSLGGLLIFGAAYTLISEAFLKRTFAWELARSLDTKLIEVHQAESIRQAGISEIHPVFDDSALQSRIMQATRVQVVVMRSATFFNQYAETLRNQITARQLQLDVALPDYRDPLLMEALARRYKDHDAVALTESIERTVNFWLGQELYQRLPHECRSRITLRLYQMVPPYSAYLFDNSELWYIPYHYRAGRHTLPVYVFKNISHSSEVYSDVAGFFADDVHSLAL